jgi:ribosomal-protein-alanine N-acetyltransferase
VERGEGLNAGEALARPERIETARLFLVVLLPSEIRALMAGDWARASGEAGVLFPEGWPQSDAVRQGLPRHLRFLESDERHRAWRVRVVVDRDTNVVVGTVNLQGPPDAEGDVEIGWGISEAWRRRGYALEAASSVTAWALAQPGATSLSAMIADDNAASQALATKLGFARTSRLRRDTPVWCRPAT